MPWAIATRGEQSGIDLSAGPGDFICILGRNAAGKSTLMRTIAGLQASLDGIVLLDGEDIASMRPATRARRIARALAQTPRLMVLDEITAFLDLPSRVEIMALLRSRARQKGQVVLLSSHDLDLSLQLSDSVWLLDGAGGFSVGTPDELSRSGAVGRAFDTDAIRFSPSHGRFEISM